MSTIRIPTPLRQYTDGNASVAISGETVGAALQDLTTQYPALAGQLFDEGKLRSFVNIYLNSEDIRYLNGEETAVSAGDALMIVPSIAGGN